MTNPNWKTEFQQTPLSESYTRELNLLESGSLWLLTWSLPCYITEGFPASKVLEPYDWLMVIDVFKAGYWTVTNSGHAPPAHTICVRTLSKHGLTTCTKDNLLRSLNHDTKNRYSEYI